MRWARPTSAVSSYGWSKMRVIVKRESAVVSNVFGTVFCLCHGANNEGLGHEGGSDPIFCQVIEEAAMFWAVNFHGIAHFFSQRGQNQPVFQDPAYRAKSIDEGISGMVFSHKFGYRPISSSSIKSSMSRWASFRSLTVMLTGFYFHRATNLTSLALKIDGSILNLSLRSLWRWHWFFLALHDLLHLSPGIAGLLHSLKRRSEWMRVLPNHSLVILYLSLKVKTAEKVNLSSCGLRTEMFA